MRLHAILLLATLAILLTGCIGQKAGPPVTTAPPAVTHEAPLDVEIEGLMPSVNATEPDLPVPDFGGDEGVDLGSVL